MLSLGEIYFATPNELKDPLEKAFFRFKLGTYARDQNNRMIYLDPEQRTKYFIDVLKREENQHFGILSLCESKKEKRMYEEYADNFRGICIGFNWEKFGLSFAGSHPPEKNIPRKVIYQSLIEIEELHASAQKWLEIFSTKSLDFEYEKEWRMFYTKGKLSGDNIRYAIEEIIFGHNVPDEYVLQVKEWIKDLDGINLFITKQEEGNPEFQIIPFI